MPGSVVKSVLCLFLETQRLPGLREGWLLLLYGGFVLYTLLA